MGFHTIHFFKADAITIAREVHFYASVDNGTNDKIHSRRVESAKLKKFASPRLMQSRCDGPVRAHWKFSPSHHSTREARPFLSVVFHAFIWPERASSSLIFRLSGTLRRSQPNRAFLGNLFTHTRQVKMAPQRNIRASHEESNFVKLLLRFFHRQLARTTF